MTDAESELACVCDLVNTWCRESGAQECSDPYAPLAIRDTIDRLWGRVNEKHFDRLAGLEAELRRALKDMACAQLCILQEDQRGAAEILKSWGKMTFTGGPSYQSPALAPPCAICERPLKDNQTSVCEKCVKECEREISVDQLRAL